jgi:hypothetical protein
VNPTNGEPTFFTPKRVFAVSADNHHADGHVAVCEAFHLMVAKDSAAGPRKSSKRRRTTKGL